MAAISSVGLMSRTRTEHGLNAWPLMRHVDALQTLSAQPYLGPVIPRMLRSTQRMRTLSSASTVPAAVEDEGVRGHDGESVPESLEALSRPSAGDCAVDGSSGSGANRAARRCSGTGSERARCRGRTRSYRGHGRRRRRVRRAARAVAGGPHRPRPRRPAGCSTRACRVVVAAALERDAARDVQAGGERQRDAVLYAADHLRLQAARVDGEPGVDDDQGFRNARAGHAVGDRPAGLAGVQSISARTAIAPWYSL